MAHSPQVRVSEDFEDDLMTNWTSVASKVIAVSNGVAERSSGSPAIAWQSENPPQSSEQHIQANVVVTSFGAGQYISLLARLDSDVTSASYSPKDGYQMRLVFTATGNCDLFFYRYNKQTGGQEDALTNVDVSSSMLKVSSTELGVLQEIRFTVTNEENGVRLRGFVNNDDDENPTLTYLDRGVNVSRSFTTKDAGYWGMMISAAGLGVDSWDAQDKYVVPQEGKHVGRTLAQLRTLLSDRISRGGNRNLTDAYLDTQLNLAQNEVMTDLGDLALFTKREETMTLTSTDSGKTFELPTRVETLIDILRSPSRTPVDWSLLNMNQENTGIRVRMSQNIGGESVFVIYKIGWQDMLSDTDRCAVPRQFDESVILSAVLRIAERQGDMTYFQTVAAMKSAADGRMRSYLNKTKRMQHTAIQVREVRHPTVRNGRYVSSPYDLR
tara:strand:+ start:8208 stop:9527 length:1320 start_codon:yes stop_codon:yes gene_type:complete